MNGAPAEEAGGQRELGAESTPTAVEVLPSCSASQWPKFLLGNGIIATKF